MIRVDAIFNKPVGLLRILSLPKKRLLIPGYKFLNYAYPTTSYRLHDVFPSTTRRDTVNMSCLNDIGHFVMIPVTPSSILARLAPVISCPEIIEN